MIQEEFDLKGGYCLDPFFPILTMDDEPAAGIADRLFSIARVIDELGNKADYQAGLQHLAEKLKAKQLAWYEIGLTAWKLKLYKAWDKTYDSFKSFCEQALGRTSATINGWIRAARVVSQLIAAGFDRLPMTASIAQELSKFAEEDLIEAWCCLCDEFEDHEMTLEKVKDFLHDPTAKPKFKTLRVPMGVWRKFEEYAASAGMPPHKLLEQMMGVGEEEIDSEEVFDDEALDEELEEDQEEASDEETYTPNFVTRYRSNFEIPEDEYYSYKKPVNKPDLVPY